jgi:hypothetical protein
MGGKCPKIIFVTKLAVVISRFRCLKYCTARVVEMAGDSLLLIKPLDKTAKRKLRKQKCDSFKRHRTIAKLDKLLAEESKRHEGLPFGSGVF